MKKSHDSKVINPDFKMGSDSVPLFSVVIPMYNREKLIGRVIQSCLDQTYTDFEIVIVDDASTDGSVSVVRNYKDPRIRLIKHEENCERLISRNHGAAAARGQWIIWLDSDDELLPHAMEIMKKRIAELPSDVMGMCFRCQLESGFISPESPYLDEIWDYRKYIEWLERHVGKWSEYMPVTQRQVSLSVKFPEDREYSGELQFHLDFFHRHRARACTDILRIYHLDATNNTWITNSDRVINASPVRANRSAHIIRKHGEALSMWAPKTYALLLSTTIVQYLLARERFNALKLSWEITKIRSRRVRILGTLIIGVISPRLLLYFKIYWNRAIKWKRLTRANLKK